MYPKPCSIYLRGTVGLRGLGFMVQGLGYTVLRYRD